MGAAGWIGSTTRTAPRRNGGSRRLDQLARLLYGVTPDFEDDAEGVLLGNEDQGWETFDADAPDAAA